MKCVKSVVLLTKSDILMMISKNGAKLRIPRSSRHYNGLFVEWRTHGDIHQKFSNPVYWLFRFVRQI